MIVKNEEKTLKRCLDSVNEAVDEIIIVDTGSGDKTKEIALKYTDKIFDFQWINDFSAARNYAFSKATKEYILWLDADDVIDDEDRKKLIALKNAMDSSVDSVTMNYNLAYDKNGNVTSSLRRNRLVRRACHFKWIGAVHEYLAVYGNIINSDIAVIHESIEHESDRNIKIYEERLNKGEEFSPRDLYYYANELRDHGTFDKAAEFYEKFLNTGQGWVEDNIGACGKLADCYYNLKDRSRELMYTLKSFEYDSPRAEFCCRLGYYFLNLSKYREAIFWYKLASELEKPKESWGQMNHSCWTWLPHLQLCVCYDRLGEHELASRHNELAAQYIPDDPRIDFNRKYFENKLKK
ncbi:glycosyltransferase family 2 protein [Oxobacter pfennigii]|nr:glycosyltransferase family 2 protein [Oxobacter pfennigii]